MNKKAQENMPMAFLKKGFEEMIEKFGEYQAEKLTDVTARYTKYVAELKYAELMMKNMVGNSKNFEELAQTLNIYRHGLERVGTEISRDRNLMRFFSVTRRLPQAYVIAEVGKGAYKTATANPGQRLKVGMENTGKIGLGLFFGGVGSAIGAPGGVPGAVVVGGLGFAYGEALGEETADLLYDYINKS